MAHFPGCLHRLANERAVASTGTVADGLYVGGSQELSVELRIDCDGCGVISGDLFRRSGAANHYVASFRTAPGQRAVLGSASVVLGQDEHDRRAQGTLSLEKVEGAAGALMGQLRFEAALEGLPTRRSMPFVVEYRSRAFRRIGLEMEIEDGVEPIAAYRAGDREFTIASALQSAGIDTHVSGLTDRIPHIAGGWQMAQLHALMSDLAQVQMVQRSWDLHLLVLSNSDRRGLLGVMFDSADPLPRQGCAVFAGEIRGIAGIDHDRKLLQTTVHELGHALNLAHRFERVVGRADSLSFMNYDWRYRGGNRSSEFWNQFAFTFDDDELEFMRHAPLSPAIPGGAPFHSVPYWSDGNGGYSPYVPETPLPDWQLELAPATANALYRFAQPVFMQLRLTNTSTRIVQIPKFLLDPKAGFVEIVIRRVHAGAIGMAGTGAQTFTPAMQRCFEWDAADPMRLGPGESIEDNLNLTFGSGGFAFAEPGTYDVTALLVLFDEANQRELVARSGTVRLRIAAPRSDEEEREAIDFFSPDVGLYLALGGTPTLPRARETLTTMVERRGSNTADPLVAHAVRAMAIESTRGYVRFRNDQFEWVAADLPRAVRGFDALAAGQGPALDTLTRRQTEALALQCRQSLAGQQGPVSAAIGPRKRAARPASAMDRLR